MRSREEENIERILMFFVDYMEIRVFLLFVTAQPDHSFSSKLLGEHDL